MKPLETPVLPPGIRSRFVEEINGLKVHILEAGFDAPGRQLVLMLHGFPEIAYSWRKVMPALAAAGYHVVAPDLRGYGRTTGWAADYDTDLRPFRLLNAVRDTLGLGSALGYRRVAAVVGHDFGAAVAAWCALVRPDVFGSLALMSAPFAGLPELPFNSDGTPLIVPGAGPYTRRWLPFHGPASITNGTIRIGRPMPRCGIVAGRPRFPPRLFSSQERRLEAEPPTSARLIERG
jgi:pimeloyl-ACP methyl ester carboxylesterase